MIGIDAWWPLNTSHSTEHMAASTIPSYISRYAIMLHRPTLALLELKTKKDLQHNPWGIKAKSLPSVITVNLEAGRKHME